MRVFLLNLFVCLFLIGSCNEQVSAQQTTVSATVPAYAGGSATATFVNGGGGTPPPPLTVPAAINSSGFFSMVLATNTNPAYAPSTWDVKICQSATQPPTCYTAHVITNGITQDITQAFSNAPTLAGLQGYLITGQLSKLIPLGPTLYFSTVDGSLNATPGSITYPAAGIVTSTGSAFGSSLTAPSGDLVGTTDVQTLTNKTVDGALPAEIGYLSGVTSAVQTQINGKQQSLTLTTTGTSGAATLVGGTLNIPQYSGGGGGIPYPSGSGVPIVNAGSAWGTTVTAPAGTIVGTTDTQTLTNKTVDGVTPTTFGYLDVTSSAQTQLNGKQGTLTLTTTGTSGAATLTGGTLNIPQYSGITGTVSNNKLVIGTGTSSVGTNSSIGMDYGSGYLNASVLISTGTLGGGAPANSTVLDYYNGNGRLFSIGPDNATAGGFQVLGLSANGTSIIQAVIQCSSAGLCDFPIGISGPGSGITSINGSNISSGNLALARMTGGAPSAANQLYVSSSTSSAAWSSTPAFSGSNITALNASNIASGTVPAANLPLASTSAFGAVKCDGTTITCTSGVIAAVGGSGTVTSVAVSGANGIGVSGSPVTNSGTIALSLGAITPASVAAVGAVSGSSVSAGSGSTACGSATGCIALTEGSTAGTPTASNDYMRSDSTAHAFKVSLNNGAEFTSLMNYSSVALGSQVTGTLPVANGGTGTASPGLVAGTNVTISGTWPNQTINSTGGGGMTYPSGTGIAVVSSGSAWGTTLAAPTGTIVGTSDTQTLTNKTIDGVTPTTMGYVDPTSSIQTQLNAKQGTLTLTTTGTSGAATLTGGTLNIPNYATGGSVSHYYTSTTFTGIGPTSFTPTHTLDIKDTTATTGSTSVTITAGANQATTGDDLLNIATSGDPFVIGTYGNVQMGAVTAYAGYSVTGLAAVQGSYKSGNQTASIAAQTLVASGQQLTATSQYQINCVVRTSAVSSGTLTLTYGWQDVGGTTQSKNPLVNSTGTTYTPFSAVALTTGFQAIQPFIIETNQAANITVATTLAGGTATYTLNCTATNLD